MESWPKAAVKALGILAGCACALVVGCVLAFLALLWILAPGDGCEAPCDAPVYVAAGGSLVLGPLLSILLFAAAAAALRKRRRSSAAGTPVTGSEGRNP